MGRQRRRRSSWVKCWARRRRCCWGCCWQTSWQCRRRQGWHCRRCMSGGLTVATIPLKWITTALNWPKGSSIPHGARVALLMGECCHLRVHRVDKRAVGEKRSSLKLCCVVDKRCHGCCSLVDLFGGRCYESQTKRRSCCNEKERAVELSVST